MITAQPPPVLEKFGNVTVVRDDLLDGGSKMRFLPLLVQGATEVVFGGPRCGGAPWALSVYGRESGIKISLFYAKSSRENWHRRQIKAEQNGACIHEVPFGYMTNVQAKARQYAEQAGALFLPLGFDSPEAEEPFVAEMEAVRGRVGSPDFVWCASGSGMMARCAGLAFPNSEICAVAVGLRSRWSNQSLPSNVTITEAPYKFEQTSEVFCPFNSCGHYERKAWEMCSKDNRYGSRLFWNVAGN